MINKIFFELRNVGETQTDPKYFRCYKENYEQRGSRHSLKERPSDSSSDDEVEELREVESNRFFFAEEEDYSMEEAEGEDCSRGGF